MILKLLLERRKKGNFQIDKQENECELLKMIKKGTTNDFQSRNSIFKGNGYKIISLRNGKHCLARICGAHTEWSLP